MTNASAATKLQRLRCAIYTRKSSEEGLEQDFNSLDAQREACEAYILSQRHAGWIALPDMYDDGGISGATLERPSVQRLFNDVRDGKVDCVVVYKVDRLTRSLADFAKIVEIFDASSVSFVSVTQQFNTTSSMGRLTLNVLLSFAQFEREIAGERIRDKIAASKKKGMWMGGYPPLGYDVRDRKLVITPHEAETVRDIFRRYLELGAVSALRDDLNQQGITSKQRIDKNGKSTGGKPFARGALYHMLKNRIYIGEIVHKDSSYPGEHPPIIERSLWDAVAKRLEDNTHDRADGLGFQEPSLLTGILYDGEGCRLTPSHAVKTGKRYRYYVSNSLITGPRSAAPRGRRVPASDIETLVGKAVKDFLSSGAAVFEALSGTEFEKVDRQQILSSAADLALGWEERTPAERRAMIRRIVCRVVIQAERIDVEIDRWQVFDALTKPEKQQTRRHGQSDGGQETFVLKIDAVLKRAGQGMRLVVRDATAQAPNTTLISLFVKAFDVREKILNGTGESIEASARRIKTNANYITALLRISFLAPDIVAAVLDGRHPTTLTARNFITKTHTLPRDWSLQRRHLGF
ncbi:MAG: recombinase family protein [Hyphomicrobium sp.]|nr:recombinase family protein [Hyphomicrobium sp.]